MQLKSINTITIIFMFVFALLILFFSVEFPSANSSIPSPNDSISLTLSKSTPPEPFKDLFLAFKKWDSQVGCAQFRQKHEDLLKNGSKISTLHNADGEIDCNQLKMNHVNVLVKGWTWIPDNMDNLYSCRCGLSCLWTKSSVLSDKPDALLFETTSPPVQRQAGDPLRVYMNLEPGRKRSGREDIFISYHAKDDVQSTYAGALFHNNRNYHLSSVKNNDTLVYWSSSRCLPRRNQLAKSLLSLLPHHSFGKCLNNVGGLDQVLSLYPEYSYVTEKLFYALDSGSIPIYFGAPNVWDFIPPHSIIDGKQFSSMEELAIYVKALANDPVAYAEYHAWRRCGVLGNYTRTRAASLDTLPCRLCEAVSRKNGRNTKAQ
ncbi:alpha-(1,4)-fucosyltransferase [Olea europaea subsp. europaea]|uniref:Fucosyltransferase n=1 Tax=Olea europaea subsp. europaea TaxID=158383 RepID=A0A8S0SX18_OLEEU|nr:alpha-(1,4)-fucosyltransferase [Olea europaea subsp. europaea]